MLEIRGIQGNWPAVEHSTGIHVLYYRYPCSLLYEPTVETSG
jgi:hypothetical protein